MKQRIKFLFASVALVLAAIAILPILWRHGDPHALTVSHIRQLCLAYMSALSDGVSVGQSDWRDKLEPYMLNDSAQWDAWGNAIEMMQYPAGFLSGGPDGKVGTRDDIAIAVSECRGGSGKQ